MLYFKKWLTESKGLRITDKLDQEIEEIMPHLLKAALHSVEKGETKRDEEGKIFGIIPVATMEYPDPYTGVERKIQVSTANLKGFSTGAYWASSNSVLINVYNKTPEDITPRWLRRLLVHELIHSMDPKVNNPEIAPKNNVNTHNDQGEVEDRDKYNMQEPEFDANIGQIVDTIIKTAKLVAANNDQKLKAATLQKLNDTLTFIRNPELSVQNKGPKGFFVGNIEYWNKFWYYYDKDSEFNQKDRPSGWAAFSLKRKMYQRIYKAVMDAMVILGNK